MPKLTEQEKQAISAAEIEKLSKRVNPDGCAQERFVDGLKRVIGLTPEQIEKYERPKTVK
jgi:hypothetical protein